MILLIARVCYDTANHLASTYFASYSLSIISLERTEMKGMYHGPDDDTTPISACTHANYDLLRYADAEVAQQLHLIQNSRHLLQRRRMMMMMMTNAHSLQTPSYARRFLTFSGNANGGRWL